MLTEYGNETNAFGRRRGGGVGGLRQGCRRLRGLLARKVGQKRGRDCRQKKSNYFLNKINVFTGKEESLLLSEKDGALSINTGIGEIPIKLSDDGKELYVERRRYVKTDAAMKDKIIAHQKKCGQTAQAYLDARNALPSNQTYQQRQAAIEQLKRRFEAEFDELEKEIKCNGRTPALLLWQGTTGRMPPSESDAWFPYRYGRAGMSAFFVRMRLNTRPILSVCKGDFRSGGNPFRQIRKAFCPAGRLVPAVSQNFALMRPIG